MHVYANIDLHFYSFFNQHHFIKVNSWTNRTFYLTTENLRLFNKRNCNDLLRLICWALWILSLPNPICISIFFPIVITFMNIALQIIFMSSFRPIVSHSSTVWMISSLLICQSDVFLCTLHLQTYEINQYSSLCFKYFDVMMVESFEKWQGLSRYARALLSNYPFCNIVDAYE